MLFIAQLEVLLWHCINCESSIFIMLLITASKNVCVEVYEYRTCFGKTSPCLLDDSRRFLTCIWLIAAEIIIFLYIWYEVRLVIKNTSFSFVIRTMEDLLKLDYFNLVREKLEGISSLKSFCRLKTVWFCLFVCFWGGGEGIFCLHLSIASLVDLLSASPV